MPIIIDIIKGWIVKTQSPLPQHQPLELTESNSIWVAQTATESEKPFTKWLGQEVLMSPLTIAFMLLVKLSLPTCNSGTNTGSKWRQITSTLTVLGTKESSIWSWRMHLRQLRDSESPANSQRKNLQHLVDRFHQSLVSASNHKRHIIKWLKIKQH